MTLRDETLLSLLITETERGNTLFGGYKEVLSRLVPELPYSHFRSLQLSRVGRKWEELYQVSFSYLCPDLRNFGSDWVGV